MTKKTQNDSYSLKDILSSIKAFLCKYWLVYYYSNMVCTCPSHAILSFTVLYH